MAGATRVYLEVGRSWTFACAVDWPGWCRRGKTPEEALETLRAYAPRYAAVGGRAFKPTTFDVVGRVAGNATTDFGAPSVTGTWDDEPLSAKERDRLADLLEKTWQAFDSAAAHAPAALRKGPRGGGRDRDAIAAHVREAERSYARKVQVRVPPRTSWAEQRAAITEAVRGGADSGSWPLRYLVRRIAWHVMDHAWEIEDRSP